MLSSLVSSLSSLKSTTCGDLKHLYRNESCCGRDDNHLVLSQSLNLFSESEVWTADTRTYVDAWGLGNLDRVNVAIYEFFPNRTVNIKKGPFTANNRSSFFELYQGKYGSLDVFGGAQCESDTGAFPYSILSEEQYARFMSWESYFGFVNTAGWLPAEAVEWMKNNSLLQNLTTLMLPNRRWLQDYSDPSWQMWAWRYPYVHTSHGPEFALLISPDKTKVYEVFYNVCDDVNSCNYYGLGHNKYVVSLRPGTFLKSQEIHDVIDKKKKYGESALKHQSARRGAISSCI